MPTFELERLPNEPVLLLTLQAGYSAEADLSKSNPEVFTYLEATTEPLCYVIDAREASFSVEDMIHIASTTSLGKQSTFTHPNVSEVIIITDNVAVKMAVKGLDSDAFGHVKVSVFSTFDEALDHLRV